MGNVVQENQWLLRSRSYKPHTDGYETCTVDFIIFAGYTSLLGLKIHLVNRNNRTGIPTISRRTDIAKRNDTITNFRGKVTGSRNWTGSRMPQNHMTTMANSVETENVRFGCDCRIFNGDWKYSPKCR
jgi:hypothetical protein